VQFLRNLLARSSSSSARIRDLELRVEQLVRSEAVRAGEWSDVLDRFNRLYKRLAARQAREDQALSENPEQSTVRAPIAPESPLAMRQRMRGL